MDRILNLGAAIDHFQKLKEFYEVKAAGKQISTVQDWISCAQAAEQLLPPSEKPRGDNKPPNPTSNPSKGRNDPPNQESKDRKRYKRWYRKNNSSDNPSDRPTGVCWTYGSKDHFSGNKSCPKYAEWVRSKAEREKAKSTLLGAQGTYNRVSAVWRQNQNPPMAPSGASQGKDKAKP